ncbi:hypothetical protein FIBSPDRAFT_923970 [Athelia psychrophila]|uniref:Uncharacterized protein n=1 Tax=Athelia psychrophila TaxID=1759441 RepID=A0A166X660_9AGAM|nr:hypothetical protein FIBSPDRAFT_923970 [Fibularhizoctonia sp. CBS 109695]
MAVSTCFFLLLTFSSLNATAASSCSFGENCFPSLSTLAAFNAPPVIQQAAARCLFWEKQLFNAGHAQLISALAKITPNLYDMGVGSLMEVFPTKLSFFALLPGGSLANFEAAFQPIVTLLPAGSVTFANFSTFLGFYAATYGATPEAQVLSISIAGLPFALSSRLIPRHYFEDDSQGLTRAIQKGQLALGAEASSLPIQILVDSPATRLNVGNTSITPVWYSSPWHVVYSVTWNNTNLQIRNRSERLSTTPPVSFALMHPTEVYIQTKLIYMNQIMYRAQAFWGADNAARLAVVKGVW